MHHRCQLKKNVYWKSKKWVEYQAIFEEIESYQLIIETLMWVVCQTWSDIVYAVSKCSRYSMNSILDHNLAVKQIIQYLVNIAELRLWYESFKVKKVLRAYQDWIELVSVFSSDLTQIWLSLYFLFSTSFCSTSSFFLHHILLMSQTHFLQA